MSVKAINGRCIAQLRGLANVGHVAPLPLAQFCAKRAREYAHVGTHRDDLEILMEDREIRKYGSSGQQRSAFLMLQLANIEIYFAQRGEYPLFLLDAIDAEHDYNRIGQLLEYLRDKTQTFVTTSKGSFADEFGRGARLMRVENGSVVERSTGIGL